MASVPVPSLAATPTNAAPLPRLFAYAQALGLEAYLYRAKRGVGTLALVWLTLAWRGTGRPERLWLGGVISQQRDRVLITALVQQVQACAHSLAILVCVDGLASYVTAFLRVFRAPIRTGRRGRPRLLIEPGLLLGQVVKQYAKRRVVRVRHQVVRGTAEAIQAVLSATATGTEIQTAYIERLNATFRGRLAPLVRRGRALAHREATLRAGMWLVGCASNFCWPHASLRLATVSSASPKWLDRTPAMAAGLTDHPWALGELFHRRVPPPRWVAPKRRGRPPKRPQQVPRLLAA